MDTKDEVNRQDEIMNKYLVITIDVEPDCSANWTYSSPLTFRGVHEGIAKRLQPLFIKYNYSPTYLINNVVLEDKRCCEILKNLKGRFELGTHLHPEFIEPAKTEWNYAGKKGEANCCYYPPEIEYAKIKNITELFTQQFGYLPVSFRAGRFSAGTNTIESLDKLGYKVDTSVTPHVNWNDKTRERPVDYSHAPDQPYRVKELTLLEADKNGRILEIPVTIANRKVSLFSELKRTYLGMRHKIERRRPVWLRPVFSDLTDFISLIDEFSHKYSENDNIVYNMMFHNVEVMPGLSPYAHSESDAAAYLSQLENFFIYCKQNNIQGITLHDAYQLYAKP
ncbi:MAG TPA: hypothetical protein VM101_08285 [Flavitalea sp.]|nr:hypothetical protein [Flavitalea sp.]